MRTTLLIHIAAGSLAILAGAVALYAAKGARLHRKSGMLFVYAMLVMGLTGAAIAALTGVETSVTGGLLAAYLVVTGVTTVRPPSPGLRRVDRVAMLVGLIVGLANVLHGFDTLASGKLSSNGVPVPMILFMGSVALLAVAADLRAIRAGGIQGPRRIARHLWRMCFALFVATGSFFLGQADELPEPLRIWPLLTLLAFFPLLAMFYWLWRVRIRRRSLSPDTPVLPAAGRL